MRLPPREDSNLRPTLSRQSRDLSTHGIRFELSLRRKYGLQGNNSKRSLGLERSSRLLHHLEFNCLCTNEFEFMQAVSVRNRTARFVSLKLTPTIGGPYGHPYAVPSGGPRALRHDHTHTRERDHKDPGLLHPRVRRESARHCTLGGDMKNPSEAHRSGGVQKSGPDSLPSEGPSASSARVDARRGDAGAWDA